MIRKGRSSDIESVLLVWLAASQQAHHFVPESFWRDHQDTMRHVYLPSSDNYVYLDNHEIIGFYALVENTLAAIFVLPEKQGRGVGKRLIADAKSRCNNLELSVYKRNIASVAFYQRQGFEIIGEQEDAMTGQNQYIMCWQCEQCIDAEQ
ncbi:MULTISPECIES: N-acetyltransferase [Pseudoalteromonas]|uniref:Acetyltransferase n=1 Tax=Pseudoalteromonas luteoviolacea (strain 2ta16) TaxID=1353533 RepID=V4HBB2_PSEL2|nr:MULTISPECIES: N-acetyltransferase [Pseudoalteromonas]ESP94776.1 acetyltransferase [Pseudoalteromonas luteoviolacea 2ta16]KZN43360.1 hypothetical protein N483_08685 [Pseudoalteromonas luteoviolacea NCIMB 1944]MCG7547396.1 N-acetyltransferase [Pseudoalteromonas sp. Of7M-16]